MYISMLFVYKVCVILVNQSFNQNINNSLSTMNDAQCYMYLGKFHFFTKFEAYICIN